MKQLTIPIPRNAAEARTLANILDRALRLSADGYTYKPASMSDMYLMIAPSRAIYVVDIQQQTCTCECFKARKVCKHYLHVEYDLIQCEELERRAEEEANSEGIDSSNGAGWNW